MRSQKEMMEVFGPVIQKTGRRFKKYVVVQARPAKPGEVIVTVTSVGRETHKVAEEGDVVIRNPTKAGEQYIISGEKLHANYDALPVEDLGVWCKYQAKGEVLGIVYDGPDTQFEASWGQAMVLKTGDMLVMPHPKQDEVYRIAIVEFNETYAPA